MSDHSLDQRVAALEHQMANLLAEHANGPQKKDWRRTVGMFTADPGMQALFAEAQGMREVDRRKGRKGQTKKRRAQSEPWG